MPSRSDKARRDRALETVSIVDRFETRLRNSRARLNALTAELPDAGEQAAAAELMREAAEIAHLLAGTAGMFGRAELGGIAQQVEAEIKAIVAGGQIGRNARARRAIGPLIAALGTAMPPSHLVPYLPARAASHPLAFRKPKPSGPILPREGMIA